jgi:large repetitive protein
LRVRKAKKATMAETGTLWVCGAATKGLFVSCPIPKRVRSISAAGKKAAVTLDDGNVLVLELGSGEGKEEGKGPEIDNTLAAVPWTRIGNDKTAAHTCLSSGTFGLILSTEGEVFSWGDSNKWGELGVGGQYPQGTNTEGTPLVNSEVSKVSGSIFGKKITKVAAGTNHAVAVSESGTLYSWGRGFEGQTGTTNLGVVLSPKLVKFSSEMPIAAVSCGHNFTVCVTKQGGQLYAFGEGGCGQLGIGKCVKFSDKAVKCSALGIKRGTRKASVAPPVITSGGKQASGGAGGGGGGSFPAFVDVSCGWAHAMAKNERGEVYVWGLNAHGQLGLGHTDSVHLPMLLKDPYADQIANDGKANSDNSPGGGNNNANNETGTEYTLGSTTSEAARPPLLLKDISAYGLASAGVRTDGRVLTWGCARGGRLGHGAANQASVFEPKLVDFIAGQKISVI